MCTILDSFTVELNHGVLPKCANFCLLGGDINPQHSQSEVKSTHHHNGDAHCGQYKQLRFLANKLYLQSIAVRPATTCNIRSPTTDLADWHQHVSQSNSIHFGSLDFFLQVLVA